MAFHVSDKLLALAVPAYSSYVFLSLAISAATVAVLTFRTKKPIYVTVLLIVAALSFTYFDSSYVALLLGVSAAAVAVVAFGSKKLIYFLVLLVVAGLWSVYMAISGDIYLLISIAPVTVAVLAFRAKKPIYVTVLLVIAALWFAYVAWYFYYVWSTTNSPFF